MVRIPAGAVQLESRPVFLSPAGAQQIFAAPSGSQQVLAKPLINRAPVSLVLPQAPRFETIQDNPIVEPRFEDQRPISNRLSTPGRFVEPSRPVQPVFGEKEQLSVRPVQRPVMNGRFPERLPARPVQRPDLRFEEQSHTDTFRQHLEAVNRIRQLQQEAVRGLNLPNQFQAPHPVDVKADFVDYNTEDDGLNHAQALEQHREELNHALGLQRLAGLPQNPFVHAHHFLQPPLPVHQLPLGHFSIPGAERHRVFNSQLQQAEQSLLALHG